MIVGEVVTGVMPRHIGKNIYYTLVDPKPLVRCKDCKYWEDGCVMCPSVTWEEEDFCSFGEKHERSSD